MGNFEDTSARINKSVANVVETIEKETAEVIKQINDQVVPAVREHSSSALRSASQKLSELADYLDNKKSSGTPS